MTLHKSGNVTCLFLTLSHVGHVVLAIMRMRIENGLAKQAIFFLTLLQR